MSPTLLAAILQHGKQWCIDFSYASQAREALSVIGSDLFDREARRPGSDGDKPYKIVRGKTAVIELSGPLTKHWNCMSWFFGGTATTDVRKALADAQNDSDVESILLLIDSPGGSVSGTADLASDVASSKKPIYSYFQDVGCSAAYWIGSQASKVFSNDTALVGNIGTVMVIDDTSEYWLSKGVVTHVISTGPYKGAGADGAPIADHHLEDFQREVDEINQVFTSSVAKARGFSAEEMAELADGRAHIGANAKTLGLIDDVASLDQVLTQLQSGSRSRSSAAAAGTTTTTEVKQPMDTETIQPGKLKQAFKAFGQAIGVIGRDDDEFDEPSNKSATNAATLPEGVQAQLDANSEALKALTASKAREAAEQFEAKALSDEKAMPSEKGKLAQAYYDGLCADGGGSPAIKDGELVKGSVTKSIEAMVEARSRHGLSKEMLEYREQQGDGRNSGVEREVVDTILSRTPLGRRALDSRKAGGQ